MKPINRIERNITNRIVKIKAPEFDDLKISEIDISKRREMLIVIGKISSNIREKIINYCKNNELPYVALTERKTFKIKKEIQKAASDYSTKALLLVGDAQVIPPLPVDIKTFSDLIYEDLDDDLLPDTPVGRVFGSYPTIISHINPKLADTDIALIFNAKNTSAARHEKILKSLGFNVYSLPTFSVDNRELINYAEIIIQFSDGPIYGRVHGSPDMWLTHSDIILDGNTLNKYSFIAYPLVFSEACQTGQFGKLVKGFLNSKALYIAATGDTFNNLEPCKSWKNCLFADGFKIGLFDELDSHNTIGETKIAVERELISNLPNKLFKKYELLMTGHNIFVDHQNFLSVVQWFMFGNPMRPPAIGPRGRFDGIIIPVDT